MEKQKHVRMGIIGAIIAGIGVIPILRLTYRYMLSGRAVSPIESTFPYFLFRFIAIYHPASTLYLLLGLVLSIISLKIKEGKKGVAAFGIIANSLLLVCILAVFPSFLYVKNVSQWVTEAHKYIKIEDITPAMDKHIAVVEGTVTRCRVKEQSGIISLKINDGTGVINAMSIGKLNQFKELDNIPNVGDKVKAVGILAISKRWGASIYLRRPELVEVYRIEPAKVSIGDIKAENEGDLVQISAKIVGVEKLKFGTVLTLADETGNIDMLIYSSELEDWPEAESILRKDSAITAIGIVQGYRGDLRLRPRSVADIKLNQGKEGTE